MKQPSTFGIQRGCEESSSKPTESTKPCRKYIRHEGSESSSDPLALGKLVMNQTQHPEHLERETEEKEQEVKEVVQRKYKKHESSESASESSET